jgi:preprotein translocase subunit SecG
MAFIIGLLTLILVLDCVVLVFLVLIQLPKKEAGAGVAFGGAATDALFGAGKGNVLTQVTKWAAGIFFALAILLSLIQSHYRTRGTSRFERGLVEGGNAPPGALPGAVAPTNKPAASTSNLTIVPPPVESPIVPAQPPATNLTPPASAK